VPKLQSCRHCSERFYVISIAPAFAATAVTTRRQHSDGKETQKA
jgi:hypothetical protein